MILGTEEFNTGVSKVYFRPTKRRPVNYIYVNTCDLDVINAYPWRRLEGCVGYKDKDAIRNLGSLIWEKYNKDPAQFVLRLNNCEIDYTYENLGNSPSRQNRRMIPHRGYSLRSEKCEFVVTATYDIIWERRVLILLRLKLARQPTYWSRSSKFHVSMIFCVTDVMIGIYSSVNIRVQLQEMIRICIELSIMLYLMHGTFTDTI